MTDYRPAPWGDPEFDAPLGGTAADRDRLKLESLGVRLEETMRLREALRAQLAASDWGFAQLGDLEDERQRAVVSGQIGDSADGVADHLLEARLHERALRETVGPHGLSMPHRGATLNDHLRHDWIGLHIVGFFRAFGSTLDCLAAVLIGALRVPLSIQRADMGILSRFDPERPGPNAPADVPNDQRTAWRELTDALAAQREREPRGWSSWGLEMRNALLHRGRGLQVFLPRPTSGRLVVPGPRAPGTLDRYDPYLPKRPWLPDIEHLARGGSGGTDLWLDEPAQDTVTGLYELLNAMVEDLGAWVRSIWDEQAKVPTFIAPFSAWSVPRELEIDFSGCSPRPHTQRFSSLVASSQDVERLSLAERLRQRLAAERGAAGRP